MTASRWHDLVSYNDKHNEANGEDNQRRPFATTCSSNYGVEGPTDDPGDPRDCGCARSATCWRR